MILYEEITRRIIAAAMRIHSTLGNGFQEVIYQRAMEIEMPYENLSFRREMEMPISYRGLQIGTRRVDFFVEDKIMVELKTNKGICLMIGFSESCNSMNHENQGSNLSFKSNPNFFA